MSRASVTWETGVPGHNLERSHAYQTALVDQKVGSRPGVIPRLAAGDDTRNAVIDILGTERGLSATGDTTQS